MNEDEHYNDFESSRYHFKGEGDYFLFGFSTHGYDDIIKNGGKEVLQEAYGEYYSPTVPQIEGYNLTLGVNRPTLPKKASTLADSRLYRGSQGGPAGGEGRHQGTEQGD